MSANSVFLMKIAFSCVMVLCIANNGVFAQEKQVRQLAGLSGPYPTVPMRDDIAKGNRMLSIDGFRFGEKRSHFIESQWSLAPVAGWFAAKGLIVGMRLAYGKYTLRERGVKRPGTKIEPQTIRSFTPEGFVRYYATPYRVKPFLEFSSGYNFQFGEKGHLPSGRSERLQSGNYVATGALGLTFFASRSVSLEMQFRRRFLTNSALIDANQKVNIRFGATWFIR